MKHAKHHIPKAQLKQLTTEVLQGPQGRRLAQAQKKLDDKVKSMRMEALNA